MENILAYRVTVRYSLLSINSSITVAAAIVIIIVVGGQSREEQRLRGRCSAWGKCQELGAEVVVDTGSCRSQRTLFTGHSLNLHLQGIKLLSPFAAQFLETGTSHCISISLPTSIPTSLV